MEGLRRAYGIAEPVRRGMEMKIVESTEWRPRVMGGERAGSVHADVLSGRDAEIEWDDVFTGVFIFNSVRKSRGSLRSIVTNTMLTVVLFQVMKEERCQISIRRWRGG